MATPDTEFKQGKLEADVAEMDIKEEQRDEEGDVKMENISTAEPVKTDRSASASGSATPRGVKRQQLSPMKAESMAQSLSVKTEVVGGDVELRLDENERPRLVRKQSHKVPRRPAELFTHLPDATAQATSTFSVLRECVYANKYMGITEHALECECAEEWDATTRTNNACGDDSDCINRATKMECIGDCGCGVNCQNQRFQNKEWADVSVIQTEKKGFGLRANVDLKAHEFIFEYIGEVIGEASFRKRMSQYDEEGIKHFYFMSLTKGEFVDATKKGNLGRFCNHSCNPNCYVDKWVVGDRLRMGIFAERKIQAGEELTFNYNVDRYGAEPQPCYCGEPNCTGYIGGKTQTERATKLSQVVIEALGIDDADAWDTATAKKPRKKKASEDDEEYVNNIEPRGLDEEGVNKVMSSLMQCKEKWIAVKLLARIQRADDDKVRNRVVRFHGYRILKTALSNFEDDVNVCLQILDVLDKMPRMTRNKIQDSNIEEAVQKLTESEDERIVTQSKTLLEAWSKLEVAYRIPRVKRNPNAVATSTDRRIDRSDRRQTFERRRSRSRSKSRSPERIQAPTGPKGNAPQRANQFGGRPPPRFRPPPPAGHLPPGWFEATAPNGSIYYWCEGGAPTWQRPTAPAIAVPPPPPPKAVSDQQMLQDLIKNIVSSAPPAKQASNNATPADTPKKEKREDKWRSLPEDKQKKLYESTLQPHIMHVVGKYKNKLEKQDLKNWAKEFAKKMVDSDFKKGRVEDPSKISDKQAKAVKKHAQDFFEKAVKKKEAADKRRSEKKAKQEDDGSRTPAGSPPPGAGSLVVKDEDVQLSDDEAVEPDATSAESNQSTDTLKRRMDDMVDSEDDDTEAKRIRTDAPAPPPPPPPPADLMDTEDSTLIPDEDVSESFTHEAIASVHAASMEEMQANGGAESGFSFKGAASRPNSALGHRRLSEATQTATPPTTNSPDLDDAEREEKTARREAFAGMNPERLQRLGLDGAPE